MRSRLISRTACSTYEGEEVFQRMVANVAEHGLTLHSSFASTSRCSFGGPSGGGSLPGS